MGDNNAGATTIIEWPSAVVASMLVFLIGAVAVTAIIKYPTVAEALQIWNSLTAVVGVLTGAFVSYFFTRGAVKGAEERANQAQQRADIERARARQALAKIAGR